MALGQARLNPDTGQVYVLGPQGWTEADPESAYLALTAGALGAFGEGMVPGRRPTAPALEQFYPTASAAGTAAGILAPFALGPLAPGGAAGTMAERVAARLGQQAASGGERAGVAGVAPAAGARGAGVAPVGGARSVGAAETGMATDAGRLQESGLVARFMDELTGGAGEMTADQAKLIAVGDRLGMEALPGMRGRADSPGRMWMASYMSHPSVKFAINDTLEHNAARIEQLAMGALKSPDQPYGVEGVATALERLGTRFDRVRDSLPENLTLPADLATDIQGVAKVAPELDGVLAESGVITREDLFRLRSDLNLHATDLMAAPGQRLKGNRVGQVSARLDEFIREQLGPDMAKEWKDAREGWLFGQLMQKPGVMQPDGSISWRTMRGVLSREMPDAYRLTLEGPRRNLSPEAADFMDGIRWANAFGDLVPNSGTATRQAIGKMSVTDHAKAVILRRYIQRERDRLAAEQAAQGGAAP